MDSCIPHYYLCQPGYLTVSMCTADLIRRPHHLLPLGNSIQTASLLTPCVLQGGGDPWDTVKPLPRWFARLHRILLFDDDSYKVRKTASKHMLTCRIGQVAWLQCQAERCGKLLHAVGTAVPLHRVLVMLHVCVMTSIPSCYFCLQAVAGEESSMVLVPAWGQHEPSNCPVLRELVDAVEEVSSGGAPLGRGKAADTALACDENSGHEFVRMARILCRYASFCICITTCLFPCRSCAAVGLMMI